MLRTDLLLLRTRETGPVHPYTLPALPRNLRVDSQTAVVIPPTGNKSFTGLVDTQTTPSRDLGPDLPLVTPSHPTTRGRPLSLTLEPRRPSGGGLRNLIIVVRSLWNTPRMTLIGQLDLLVSHREFLSLQMSPYPVTVPHTDGLIFRAHGSPSTSFRFHFLSLLT